MDAFSNPLLAALLGDEEIAALLSLDYELAAMTRFEQALATAQAEHGVIPAEAAGAIVSALEGFAPDIAALKAAITRDGVPVPELVRQMRDRVGKPHGDHLHFGATSQDVVDTALVLRLHEPLTLIAARIDRLDELVAGLSRRFGANPLTAMTRMQPAIPITAADRIESWHAPLRRHAERFAGLQKTFFVVQFGGAAGTLEKLGDKGPAVRAALASRLGLSDAPQWHSQRDRIVDLANALSALTGSLGKFGQDIALMAEIGGEIELAGGGSSSAMPHKQNPVGAELLVTLARFNATLVAGMHQALVHEQERSGAAWSLEWLLLPQIVIAAGASTRMAIELAGNVRRLGVAG